MEKLYERKTAESQTKKTQARSASCYRAFCKQKASTFYMGASAVSGHDYEGDDYNETNTLINKLASPSRYPKDSTESSLWME